MFDIGWQELFIVAIIGILVIGPKDLPKAIRAVTFYLRKARGLAREFQSGLDDVVREAELDDLKKQMDKATEFDIAGEIENTLDPGGEIARDVTEMEVDLQSVAGPESGPADSGLIESFEGEAAEPEEDHITEPAPSVDPAEKLDETPEPASKRGG